MMTNGMFTMFDKHTQSEHKLNTLQNHATKLDPSHNMQAEHQIRQKA